MLGVTDDFPCLSPCLLVGYEINLTGLLAEMPVTSFTLTKYLSAIRCPTRNSMLCVNCRNLRNTCLGGVYNGLCRVTDVGVNVPARYIHVGDPAEGCPVCSLEIESGQEWSGRDVACVGDADWQVVTSVGVVDDFPR